MKRFPRPRYVYNQLAQLQELVGLEKIMTRERVWDFLAMRRHNEIQVQIYIALPRDSFS